MTKIAVFSAGSWGTAFSLVLADAGNDVTLWARRDDVVDRGRRARGVGDRRRRRRCDDDVRSFGGLSVRSGLEIAPYFAT